MYLYMCRCDYFDLLFWCMCRVVFVDTYWIIFVLSLLLLHIHSHLSVSFSLSLGWFIHVTIENIRVEFIAVDVVVVLVVALRRSHCKPIVWCFWFNLTLFLVLSLCRRSWQQWSSSSFADVRSLPFKTQIYTQIHVEVLYHYYIYIRGAWCHSVHSSNELKIRNSSSISRVRAKINNSKKCIAYFVQSEHTVYT